MADNRTYADRKEYIKAAVTKRRQKLKQMALDTKGGECKLCGYSKCVAALEFHHREDSAKDFGFSSNGYSKSWDRLKNELEKCDLLCANCHREVHSKGC